MWNSGSFSYHPVRGVYTPIKRRFFFKISFTVLSTLSSITDVGMENLESGIPIFVQIYHIKLLKLTTSYLACSPNQLGLFTHYGLLNSGLYWAMYVKTVISNPKIRFRSPLLTETHIDFFTLTTEMVHFVKFMVLLRILKRSCSLLPL